MKYLIIPDIHLKTHDAQVIIDAVDHDRVVLLGDIFDDFNDTPQFAVGAARWLQEKLRDPKCIVLWGNHDIAYGIPSRYTQCSGWTPEKQGAINSVLGPSDWSKFLPFYNIQEGNWVLSHAGVRAEVFFGRKETPSVELLDMRCREGLEILRNGGPTRFFGAGFSRGGSQPYGGITWCDFVDELSPVGGFRQVVGHRPLEKPQVMFWGRGFQRLVQTYNRFNGWDHREIVVGLDTHLKYYAVICDGVISIHHAPRCA